MHTRSIYDSNENFFEMSKNFDFLFESAIVVL